MSFWRRRSADPGPPRPASGTRPDPGAEPAGAMAALLDLLPHPVLALDRDGVLLHANLDADRQLGDALPALLRHPLLIQAVRRLGPGRSDLVDLAMDVPVRRVLRVGLRAHPERGEGGGNGLVLLSIADRTEQDAVERMRADFVANASHELRTPLASLVGFIETLQGPAADDAPARVRFLAIMATQAARMRRLIDNLLSLSQIQMHEHRRPDGRVEAGALLRRVAEAHEPQLRAGRCTLALGIAAGLPLLAADPDQLAQVLHNLLDNAVKYGARPGRPCRIVLDARPACEAVGPSPGGVVLSVSDDGPGIAPHHLPRLTERFYRAEEGQSGSGLGLAIVKHIVGRHGGRLAIESAPGEGTRVAIWLPHARG